MTQTPCVGGWNDGNQHECGCVDQCDCEGFGITAYEKRSHRAIDTIYKKEDGVFRCIETFFRRPTISECQLFFEMTSLRETEDIEVPNA